MVVNCPFCGECSMQEMTGTFTFETPANVPDGPFSVNNSVWDECSSCGEQLIPPDLNRKLLDARCERLGLLTPSDIKQIRMQTGFSLSKMAAFLGTGEKTFARWESGRSIHNKSSDNLLRLASRHPELLHEIEAHRAISRKEVIRSYVASLSDFKSENEMAMAAHNSQLDQESFDLFCSRILDLINKETNN